MLPARLYVRPITTVGYGAFLCPLVPRRAAANRPLRCHALLLWIETPIFECGRITGHTGEGARAILGFYGRDRPIISNVCEGGNSVQAGANGSGRLFFIYWQTDRARNYVTPPPSSSIGYSGPLCQIVVARTILLNEGPNAQKGFQICLKKRTADRSGDF